MSAKRQLDEVIDALASMERAALARGAMGYAEHLRKLREKAERGMIAYEVALEDALNSGFTDDGLIEDWED